MKGNRRRSLFTTSGRIAKARAASLIATDRLSCSPEQLTQMRKELLQVLSKYMCIDDEAFEIRMDLIHKTRQGVQDVKTVQIK